MFLLENGVMGGILLLSFVCLTVFIVLYKTAIEVDDVVVTVGVDDSRFCALAIAPLSFETRGWSLITINSYATRSAHR